MTEKNTASIDTKGTDLFSDSIWDDQLSSISLDSSSGLTDEFYERTGVLLDYLEGETRDELDHYRSFKETEVQEQGYSARHLAELVRTGLVRKKGNIITLLLQQLLGEHQYFLPLETRLLIKLMVHEEEGIDPDLVDAAGLQALKALEKRNWAVFNETTARYYLADETLVPSLTAAKTIVYFSNQLKVQEREILDENEYTYLGTDEIQVLNKEREDKWTDISGDRKKKPVIDQHKEERMETKTRIPKEKKDTDNFDSGKKNTDKESTWFDNLTVKVQKGYRIRLPQKIVDLLELTGEENYCQLTEPESGLLILEKTTKSDDSDAVMIRTRKRPGKSAETRLTLSEKVRKKMVPGETLLEFEKYSGKKLFLTYEEVESGEEELLEGSIEDVKGFERSRFKDVNFPLVTTVSARQQIRLPVSIMEALELPVGRSVLSLWERGERKFILLGQVPKNHVLAVRVNRLDRGGRLSEALMTVPEKYRERLEVGMKVIFEEFGEGGIVISTIVTESADRQSKAIHSPVAMRVKVQKHYRVRIPKDLVEELGIPEGKSDYRLTKIGRGRLLLEEPIKSGQEETVVVTTRRREKDMIESRFTLPGSLREKIITDKTYLYFEKLEGTKICIRYREASDEELELESLEKKDGRMPEVEEGVIQIIQLPGKSRTWQEVGKIIEKDRFFDIIQEFLDGETDISTRSKAGRTAASLIEDVDEEAVKKLYLDNDMFFYRIANRGVDEKIGVVSNRGTYQTRELRDIIKEIVIAEGETSILYDCFGNAMKPEISGNRINSAGLEETRKIHMISADVYDISELDKATIRKSKVKEAASSLGVNVERFRKIKAGNLVLKLDKIPLRGKDSKIKKNKKLKLIHWTAGIAGSHYTLLEIITGESRIIDKEIELNDLVVYRFFETLKEYIRKHYRVDDFLPYFEDVTSTEDIMELFNRLRSSIIGEAESWLENAWTHFYQKIADKKAFAARELQKLGERIIGIGDPCQFGIEIRMAEKPKGKTAKSQVTNIAHQLVPRDSGSKVYRWNLTRLAEKDSKLQAELLSGLIYGIFEPGTYSKGLGTEYGYNQFLKTVAVNAVEKVNHDGCLNFSMTARNMEDTRREALDFLAGLSLDGADAKAAVSGESLVDFVSASGRTEAKVILKMDYPLEETHIIKQPKHTLAQSIIVARETLLGRHGSLCGINIVRDGDAFKFKIVILEIKRIKHLTEARSRVRRLVNGDKRIKECFDADEFFEMAAPELKKRMQKMKSVLLMKILNGIMGNTEAEN
ncbi:MAG: hypothetical protein ACFFD4_28300 [Candidatus Odinarchaeota archaeon]